MPAVHSFRRSLSLLTPIALGSLLLAAACPRGSSTPDRVELVRRSGVLMSRVGPSDVPHGRSIGGKLGDWLIQTEALRAVVGAAESESVERTAGALLDMTAGSWDDDAIEQLRPGARAFGRRLPFRVQSVSIVDAGARPAMRVVQRNQETGLELVTDFIPHRDRLELVTRATNGGGRRLERLTLGDELRWLGRAPFVPGAGYVENHARLPARFIALPGERVGYVVVLPDGGSELEFTPTLHAPSQLFAGTPPAALAPGETLERRRTILVAPATLPGLAALGWQALGVPLGKIAGRFEPAPKWAVITAYDGEGRVTLVTEALPDGRYELPLPLGSYTLRLTGPGGSDEAGVVVAAGVVGSTDLIPPQPAQLRVQVQDNRDRALAARVIVRGLSPTPDPILGPPHSAKGAGFAAYTATGLCELELSPGRYSVVVSHGPRYSIAEREIEVSRGRGAVLRARLERVLDTPGWYAADFHIHAEPSPDSDVPLGDRVTSLLADDIEFAVATDHNHVTSYAAAIHELGAEQRLASTSGVEITTQSWGHFNAFPYPAGEPPPYADVTPAEIFAAVRTRAPAAVLQVNHPRMGDIGYFAVGGLHTPQNQLRPGFSFDFDTVEVFNGFDLAALPEVEKNLAEWFRLLESGRRYTAVGNSDSHWLFHEWVGYPRTYVRSDARSPAELAPEGVAAALRQGRAIVSNGPFIELRAGGGGIGDLVPAPGGKLSAEVTVRAAPWVDLHRAEIVVNGVTRGQVQRAAEDRAGELMLTVQLELVADAWIVALVRGAVPMERVLPDSYALPFAFTNPLYVDVDGDGKFRAQ